MMSLGTLNNKLKRRLQSWEPVDGDCVHLVVLKTVLPNYGENFWMSCLIGSSASLETRSIKRLPLQGRFKARRIVVLMSSLSAWLAHYNPDKPQTVAALMAELVKAEAVYLQLLHRRHLEYLSKYAEPPKVRVRKAPAPRKLKVADASLFSVWSQPLATV